MTIDELRDFYWDRGIYLTTGDLQAILDISKRWDKDTKEWMKWKKKHNPEDDTNCDE